MTPRDNAIAFPPGQPETMSPPWDVYMLTANEAGANVLAQNPLVKP